MLFAKSTHTSKGSVWWRELDIRGRGEGNMMKRETGRILHWRPWCSRPASNSARCLSFCLPACHPICQLSRDGEAARGAEMSGADAGAARGKSAGHRRSQLKVTWPFDFVTCHQLPCLTPHGGVPAIHHCFLLCLCLVVSLSQKKLICLFLSPAPTPSPLLILLVFPELCFYGEKWRCNFLKERCGIIGRRYLFLPVFLIFTLLYPCFCIPLNEGRCQGSRRSETHRSCLRCKIVRKIEHKKLQLSIGLEMWKVK